MTVRAEVTDSCRTSASDLPERIRSGGPVPLSSTSGHGSTRSVDRILLPVDASPRELPGADLSPMDFPPDLPVPAVAAWEKFATLDCMSTPLAATLDCMSTPLAATLARTTAEHLDSGRAGPDSHTHEFGVDRDDDGTLIEQLTARP